MTKVFGWTGITIMEKTPMTRSRRARWLGVSRYPAAANL